MGNDTLIDDQKEVSGLLNHRSMTLICILYLYTLYVVEGRTVTSLMHKQFLGELHRLYSGYNLVRIPFNKQLHALSSALYQKFATFTVLLSFCFYGEI